MEQKPTRWIRFLGGKDLIFTLVALLLTGGVLFIFHQVGFIFEPLGVIFKTVSGPVILTMVLYYLFNPLINWLEQHHIKRIISVSLLFLLIIALLIFSIILVIPIIQEQLESLIANFPGFVNQISESAEHMVQGSALEAPLNETIHDLQQWFGGITSSIGNYLSNFLEGATNVFSTITGAVLVVVTAPIITFFLLKDDQRFFDFLLRMIPPRFRKDAKEIGATMNSQVGAYLKGQILVSITIGFLTLAGFLLIQMPYAGSLSLFVGITAIVPYIGPFAAFVPSVIIALMSSFSMLVKMCLVWVVVQMLNGQLIEPQVMGKHLVVHPITIVLVLLVMGDLLGMFGLIFGIPIYAVIKVFITYLFRKFKHRYNRFYGEEGAYEETTFTKDKYEE